MKMIKKTSKQIKQRLKTQKLHTVDSKGEGSSSAFLTEVSYESVVI